MVWRTREASRRRGDPTLQGPRIRPHQVDPRPHTTEKRREEDSHPPHPTPRDPTAKEGVGFPPTRPHNTGGTERGFPHHIPNQPTRARATGGEERGADHLGGWGTAERVTICYIHVLYRCVWRYAHRRCTHVSTRAYTQTARTSTGAMSSKQPAKPETRPSNSSLAAGTYYRGSARSQEHNAFSCMHRLFVCNSKLPRARRLRTVLKKRCSSIA